MKTKTRILEEVYDTIMNNDQYQKEFNLAENPEIYPYLDYDNNEIVLDVGENTYRLHITKDINVINQSSFIDDEEKMIDFNTITKEQFLNSYSYITEEEYNLTLKEVTK
jgi:hypothetical protein